MSQVTERITPENASAKREEALASLRQAAVEQQDEAPVIETEAPAPVPPTTATPPVSDSTQAPTSAGEPVISDPATTPPATPSPDPAEPVSEGDPKYVAMEKRFKAIQASITPTQQENARLREEVRLLTEKLTTTATPEKPNGESRAEKIAKLRDILPEAADVFEELQTTQAGNGSDLEARIAETNQRLDKAHQIEVQNEILMEHKDAPAIYRSPDKAIWKWVETLGPVSEEWTDVLNYPWRYENGAERASSIIGAFKAEMAVQAPPVSPAPKRPLPTPIPTDMAPNIQSDTQSGSFGADPAKGLWTDAQHLAKNRELRTATPQRAHEIAEEIKAQLRLRNSLR